MWEEVMGMEPHLADPGVWSSGTVNTEGQAVKTQTYLSEQTA